MQPSANAVTLAAAILGMPAEKKAFLLWLVAAMFRRSLARRR